MNSVPIIMDFYSKTKEVRKILNCHCMDYAITKDNEYFLLALGGENDCKAFISLSLEMAIKLRDALTKWIDAQTQK